MSQSVEDAIVIDGGSDVVGLLLEVVDGVTHRHADASLENHRRVIAAVAEGHRTTDIKTLVAGHRQDALALVGTVGGDVGELRMPATRHALRHTGHQLRLVVGREEGGQLEDVLLEHNVERRGLVEVLHGEHLTEDAVDVALGVNDCHVLPADDDEAVAFLLAILYARHYVVFGDGLAGHHLMANKAQRAVGGDVTVNQVLDCPQIGDDDGRTARGDIHARTVGLGLRQREDGRRRNLVRLETHQRAVDVEK